MADGRGDPRDSRRENSRLTENDLDPRFFELREGRLTLKMGATFTAAVLAQAVGPGLELGADGKLAVRLGATIAYDRAGRLVVSLTEVEQLEAVTVPDPADTPASADALRDDLVLNTLPGIVAALEALRLAINALLSEGSNNARV